MRNREIHLDMKTANAWVRMVEEEGGRVVDRVDRYRPWHRQLFLQVDPGSDPRDD
jgi:hypothetical protein